MESPEDMLQFEVSFDDLQIVLVFIATFDDPGIIHAFAPIREAGVLRGMTRVESSLVEHPLSSRAIDDLADLATTRWESWSTVESLVVVHNVIDPPAREPAEA